MVTMVHYHVFPDTAPDLRAGPGRQTPTGPFPPGPTHLPATAESKISINCKIILSYFLYICWHFFFGHAEPFVLVVIRGALDIAALMSTTSLLTSRWLELHVVGTSLLTVALRHVVRTSPLTAVSTRGTMQVMQVTHAKSS